MSGLCFFADVDVVVLGVSDRAVCGFGCFLEFAFLDDDEVRAELEGVDVVVSRGCGFLVSWLLNSYPELYNQHGDT